MCENETLDLCLLGLDLRDSDLQHLRLFNNDYCLFNIISNFELNQNFEKKISKKIQAFFWQWPEGRNNPTPHRQMNR